MSWTQCKHKNNKILCRWLCPGLNASMKTKKILWVFMSWSQIKQKEKMLCRWLSITQSEWEERHESTQSVSVTYACLLQHLIELRVLLFQDTIFLIDLEMQADYRHFFWKKESVSILKEKWTMMDLLRLSHCSSQGHD